MATTSLTVNFTRLGSGGGGSANPPRIVFESEDNIAPSDQYEQEYTAANGSGPDYDTEAGIETKANLLAQDLVNSSSRKVRVYSALPLTLLRVIRGNLLGSLGKRTDNAEDYVAINGDNSFTTKYPAKSFEIGESVLYTAEGELVTPSISLASNGSFSIDQEVWGFVQILYTTEYDLVQIGSLSSAALNKPSSILLVTSNAGADSREIDYPDVRDNTTGIVPDYGPSNPDDPEDPELVPNIKRLLALYKGRKLNQYQNYEKWWDDKNEPPVDEDGNPIPDPNTPLKSGTWTETSRQTVEIDIDGVLIDRATEVSFKDGNGNNIKLLFASTP